MLWEKHGLEEWNNIAVQPSKSDAAADVYRFYFSRSILH
jgi:hypothetical protein